MNRIIDLLCIFTLAWFCYRLGEAHLWWEATTFGQAIMEVLQWIR